MNGSVLILTSVLLALSTKESASPKRSPGAQVVPPAAATSDGLDAFVDDALARIYDPRDDGLVSLSFTLPIERAALGRTANVRVSWQLDAEPEIDVERLDFDLPQIHAALGVKLEGLQRSTLRKDRAAGRHFLDRVLGEVIDGLSAVRAQSVVGVEEGNVVVSFDSLPPTDLISEFLLHIDDESVIRKHVIGTANADRETRAEKNLHWQIAKSDERLVLERSVITGEVFDTSFNVLWETFGYQEFGEIVLLTEQTSQMTIFGNPPQEVVWRVTDLVVNGQAVVVGDVTDGEGGESAAEDATGDENDSHR